MNENDICEAHRKGWNETAAIHERAALGDLLEAVRSPDFCTFDEVEKRIFDGIDLAGKDVVQLACNNARELISVKRAGAGRCVGFDISDAFVDQAHRLIEAAQLDVEVLRSNVYNIPAEYDNGFDPAYITVGAIGWLPDLSPRLPNCFGRADNSSSTNCIRSYLSTTRKPPIRSTPGSLVPTSVTSP